MDRSQKRSGRQQGKRADNLRQAIKKHGDKLDCALAKGRVARLSTRSPQSFRLEWIDPDALRLDPNNPRQHSKSQLSALAAHMRKFGFTNPILVNASNVVIAGHGRLEASKLAKLKTIPVIRLNVTDAQAKALNIWDNRSSDLSKFDERLLGLALKQTVDLHIEIDDTGFSVAEVDQYIQFAEAAEAHVPASTGNDPVPDRDDALPLAGSPVARAGDLFQLGPHRIICADAQEADAFLALLGNRRAHVVFTDVPYNLPSHVVSRKDRKRAAFKMAAGEMMPEDYRQFLSKALSNLTTFSESGSLHYHCIDWRHFAVLQSVGHDIYANLLNLCVWVKANGGMGSLYRSRHELVLVFKNGSKRHQNNVDLGRFGRNRTNVWEYPGGNSFLGRGSDEGNLLDLHPTVKPVRMIADALLDCSRRGEIVLDPFLGSGSTLIAAERVGRVCYAIEIDPQYVDVAIRRWQALTGERAIHVESRKSFDEIARRRPHSRG